MLYLIGIDDTDNATTGATGHLARDLRKQIGDRNLAHTISISRHQLFLSPEIPYTSHNSSACMMVDTQPESVNLLIDYFREYLCKYSQPGSDVGLCVAQWDRVSSAVQAFGKQAKETVLTQAQAISIASQSGIFLEGLTGTQDGIIGALAGVGLRKTGNDGRIIWIPGLYELYGTYTVSQLYQMLSIDRIQDLQGDLLSSDARIQIQLSEETKMKTGRWPRPVLIDGQAVMLVVKAFSEQDAIGKNNYEYELAPKDIIRQY